MLVSFNISRNSWDVLYYTWTTIRDPTFIESLLLGTLRPIWHLISHFILTIGASSRIFSALMSLLKFYSFKIKTSSFYLSLDVLGVTARKLFGRCLFAVTAERIFQQKKAVIYNILFLSLHRIANFSLFEYLILLTAVNNRTLYNSSTFTTFTYITSLHTCCVYFIVNIGASSRIDPV